LRFVFDTNVIVIALLLNNSKPNEALLWALHHGSCSYRVQPLPSFTMSSPEGNFRRYIEEDDIRVFLATLTRQSELIEVNVKVDACRDLKDNKFLELAVSGRATHIVTGDSDLLTLHPFQGITILSPNALLELS